MKKFKTWFWGLFFLFAAAFIIASQLGYIAAGLTLWKLILAVFLLGIAIEGVMHLEFFSMLVPLAVIGILFSRQLGIEAITPWPILGAAVFAAIGLSIIFKKQVAARHSTWRHGHSHDHTEFEETVENLESNMVYSKVSFGASIKYLHAKSLERAEFSASFGSLKVYFDQAQLSPNGADVKVECSFSGVVLYIPHNWKVVDNISTSVGSVKARENRSASEEHTLRITGSVSFGSVEIVYV